MTKKEFVEILEAYPDDVRVLVEDDDSWLPPEATLVSGGKVLLISPLTTPTV